MIDTRFASCYDQIGHLEQMLNLLAIESRFNFVLTGSRAGFSEVTEKSDWEFVVEYTPDIEHFLLTHGFNLIIGKNQGGYYLDPMIIKVYRWFDIYNQTNIDIQIVVNIKKRLRQMEKVKDCYLHILKALPKDKRYLVWQAAWKDVQYK